MLPLIAAVAALTLYSPAVAQGTSDNGTLPIVDLGYELHQATLYNSTGGFYNFSNIRYAAPPTGENRFAAPQPPAVNRSVVQQGLPDRICAQSEPAWLLIAEQFIPEYLEGQTVFNSSSFNTSSGTSGGLPAQDPRTTEDCLFLDVVVPEAIYNNAGQGYGAPVLVWIYGEHTDEFEPWLETSADPHTCRRRLYRRFEIGLWKPRWTHCPKREQRPRRRDCEL